MTILPMLAKPLPDKLAILPGRYAAEVKENGFRLVVEKRGLIVKAWSRTGKTEGMQKRMVPKMIEEIRENLPDGIYDGELVNTKENSKHYGVANLDNVHALQYVVFDVLEYCEERLTLLPYSERRKRLEGIFGIITGDGTELTKLKLMPVTLIKSREHLMEIAREIWSREGEGVIVKNISAPYFAGKRSDAFMKVKMWQSAVLTVTDFTESKGEKNYRGPCAITKLVDAEGNECAVKTKDDQACRDLEGLRTMNGMHPFIGRELRIDYTARTPDGKYENPVWDRWEDE